MITSKHLTLWEHPYRKEATLYRDASVEPVAVLLYFHGGGLLYGSREDLPELHLKTLTRAGMCILAFDYPLAPVAKLDTILPDVIASINSAPALLGANGLPSSLPYFLFGRSAGAYLVLLAAAVGELERAPSGILSYYGYGFLTDHWYETPNDFYRTFPIVDANRLAIPEEIHCTGALATHYSLYVYARQNGKWKELFYCGRDKHFYTDYTLRLHTALPAPLFAVHSTEDPDVPFAEFRALVDRYGAETFLVSGAEHDFDRRTESPTTKALLEETLRFLARRLS